MRPKGRKPRTTLNISKDTKDAMDVVRVTGQSYDGLIRMLLEWYIKEIRSRLERKG